MQACLCHVLFFWYQAVCSSLLCCTDGTASVKSEVIAALKASLLNAFQGRNLITLVVHGEVCILTLRVISEWSDIIPDGPTTNESRSTTFSDLLVQMWSRMWPDLWVGPSTS